MQYKWKSVIHQSITTEYSITEPNPTPVHLEISPQAIRHTTVHSDLQQALQELNYQTNKMYAIIKANNKQITQILTKIKETTNHSQWESLLGSPTDTGILILMLHPIVILFILMIIVLFSIMFQYCKLVFAFHTVQARINEAKVMAIIRCYN